MRRGRPSMPMPAAASRWPITSSVRFSRGRCCVSNSGARSNSGTMRPCRFTSPNRLAGMRGSGKTLGISTSSLAVAKGASRRMWPMRNAWRTMSFGFSSIGPVDMAASSAGSGGSPSGDAKLAFMEWVRGASGAGDDGSQNLVRGIGLGDVALHTQHLGPYAVGLLVLAGDQYHRDALGRRVATDGTRGGKAIDLGAVEVPADDVRR